MAESATPDIQNPKVIQVTAASLAFNIPSPNPSPTDPTPTQFNDIVLSNRGQTWSSTLSNLTPNTTYTFTIRFSSAAVTGGGGGNQTLAIDGKNVWSYFYREPDGYGAPGHEAVVEWTAGEGQAQVGLTMTHGGIWGDYLVMAAAISVKVKG